MAAISLPSISAIRNGASAVLAYGDSKLYELRVARKSDIRQERTAHVVAGQQPTMLRRDGAQARTTQHQISASGESESCMAYMPNHKLFARTGYFAPLDVNDDRIVTAKYWRSSVAIMNAVTRELARRAAAGDDTPISAATFWHGKPSAELQADLDKAAACGGVAKAGRASANYRDSFMHALADLAICGAVVAPCDGGRLRSNSTMYKINQAWLPALAAAHAMHEAADAPADVAPVESEASEPVMQAEAA